MAQEKHDIIRSPEVQDLLEKKLGFFLGYGNLLFIIFIIAGIIASKELKYPIYRSYDLHSSSVSPSFENSRPFFFIKVPITDFEKFDIKENITKINLDRQGQISEIGILGNQIEFQNDEVSYEVILANDDAIPNKIFDKPSNKVLLILGETSLFEQFFSQLKKNVSRIDDV